MYLCVDNDTGREIAMKVVETAFTNPATQKVCLCLIKSSHRFVLLQDVGCIYHPNKFRTLLSLLSLNSLSNDPKVICRKL